MCPTSRPAWLGAWISSNTMNTWWCHQMETFYLLLAICAGNSPVPGVFPAQSPVTRSFDVFFDLRLNKRLSKQWWGWWYETLSHPLWCHCNEEVGVLYMCSCMTYFIFMTLKSCHKIVFMFFQVSYCSEEFPWLVGKFLFFIMFV